MMLLIAQLMQKIGAIMMLLFLLMIFVPIAYILIYAAIHM